MYINGKYYNYKYFVYDGCHKIYLIHKKDFKTIKAKGYEKDDIFPIEALKDVYEYSCPLRFIGRWDNLENDIVPQCSDSVLFGKPEWKQTKLSNNDFNVLEECADKVFRHSEDWFYEKYYNRKRIEIDDLKDLRDVYKAGFPSENDLVSVGVRIENDKIRLVWYSLIKL